jgi:hypothetical protein
LCGWIRQIGGAAPAASGKFRIAIVVSGLGFVTGKWVHFKLAGLIGLLLLAIWWVVLKARAKS